jgi:hypothetical protein
MTAHALRPALRLATFLVAMLGTSACGSKSRPPAAAPDAKTEIAIAVESTQKTNDGRPLHVVVRAVDRATWAADSYASIADLVSRKDESVQTTFVVFPGHEAEARLQVSTRKPIAVYFLFTQPGKPWRKLIDAPLARRIELRLASSSIEEQEPEEEEDDDDQ